jgi:transketolase
MSFRQWHSGTPGHPENFVTAGVETTTGPLGQGFANAVGLAIAERWLAAHYNRPGRVIVDHYTYVIASDGDMMEGISHEAAALAGHLGLGKLIVFYDDNSITIDGPTALAMSEDVPARFAAYKWHTMRLDAHDPEAIAAAIRAAQSETERPTLIACRSHIGFGSPNKQDSAAAHGEPLGVDEVRLTKERLGLPPDRSFYIADEARTALRANGQAGATRQAEWQARLRQYEADFPAEAANFIRAQRGELPAGWQASLPHFAPGKAVATRVSSGQTLEALAAVIPNLIGGSGDLTPSNKTLPKGWQSLSRDDFSGRYIRFGVREHGMGGILNGLGLHGGLRPYGGTFLIFSDYMRPAIRLAALSGIPAIYVFTHDSIGLGEDGPTHQPIEHLMALRAIPNLVVFRPADATETAIGWQVALERTDGPTALALTRQNVPILDRERYAPAAGALRGGYILSDAPEVEAILLATGSEVAIALQAQELLAAEGIGARVVSLPSWELFEAQPKSYRNEVLPRRVTARVAMEAGATLGWPRYVGRKGVAIGLDRYGASAPYEIIYEKLGLTAAAMAAAARKLVEAGAKKRPRRKKE